LAVLIHVAFQVGGIILFSSYSINILMKYENMKKAHAVQWSTFFGIAEIAGNLVGMAIVDLAGKKKILLGSFGL